jgi:hypothetical protein
MGLYPHRFQRRGRHRHRSAALVWALVLAWSTLIGPAAPLHALDLGGTVLPQALGTTASPTFAALTLSSPLSVPNGGTGATTAAAHGVMVGEGTSAFVAVGPGAANSVLTGQGASADPSFSTTPQVASLTATGAIRAQGSLGTNAAQVALDYGSGARLISQGADASTNGAFRILSTRSDGSNGVSPFLTDTSNNIALGVSGQNVAFVSNTVTFPKITSPGTAPGAATCRLEFVAGTNANTCKAQLYCGTSTTPVVLVDNVGSGC